MRPLHAAAIALSLGYFGILAVAPAFRADWRITPGFTESVWNTVLYASVATILCIPAAALLGYGATRLRLRFAYALILFSTAIPHTAIGVLLAPLMSSLGLFDTPGAVVFSMWIVSLPYATAIVRASLEGLGREFEEYLRCMGVGGFRLLYLHAKAASYGFAAAAMLAWLRAFSELGVLLLIAPRPITVGIQIYEIFLKYGAETVTTASLLLVPVGVVSVYLLSLVEKRAAAP